MTGIEWTNEVWNPTTGCDRVSPGCDNCYALTMAKRLKGMGAAKYQRDGNPRTSGPGFGVSVHSDVLGKPMAWKAPRKIFVNSMSDLFHDEVPDAFVAKVFAVMAATPRHTYQLLTKRHARMRALLNDPEWRSDVFLRESVLDLRGPARPLPVWPLPNVHLGVSVETQQWADIRIPALLDTPAAVRWLSCEPLLGPVDLAHHLVGKPSWGEPYAEPGSATGLTVRDLIDGVGIDWVVVGGESGPGARPMQQQWARSLRDQCVAAGVPFFFKQWGDWVDSEQMPETTWSWLDSAINLGQEMHPEPHRVGKKRAGRLLDGRTWDEYPTADLTAAS